MSELNFPPFYVGQKITPIKNGLFHKEGLVYTASESFFCPVCKEWHVLTLETVRHPASAYHCDCGKEIGDTVYLGGNSKYFVPVQENFQSISLSKVLEEETKLISVN